MPSYIEIAPDGTRREVAYDRSGGPVSKRLRIIARLKWLGRRPHIAKPGEVADLNRALRELQFPSNPQASRRLPAKVEALTVADIPRTCDSVNRATGAPASPTRIGNGSAFAPARADKTPRLGHARMEG